MRFADVVVAADARVEPDPEQSGRPGYHLAAMPSSASWPVGESAEPSAGRGSAVARAYWCRVRQRLRSLMSALP